MKLSGREVREAYQALRVLGQSPMPARTTMRVRQKRKALEPAFETTEEAREDLLNKHAKLDDADEPVTMGDGTVVFEPGGEETFREEYEEALEESFEVEIPGAPIAFSTIAETRLPDNPPVLDWLIDYGLVEE